MKKEKTTKINQNKASFNKFQNSLSLKENKWFQPKKQNLNLPKVKSSLSGFKKVLFNFVCVQDDAFAPRYNRRKHGLSQDLLLNQPLRKLHKIQSGLKKKVLKHSVAFALKQAYEPNVEARPSRQHLLKRCVPCLTYASWVESHPLNLVSKTQNASSLAHAKQKRNHAKCDSGFVSNVINASAKFKLAQTCSKRHAWATMAQVSRSC